MSRVITDVLKTAASGLLTSATLTFRSSGSSYDGGTVLAGQEEGVTSDASTAAISITLLNGTYQVFLTPSGGSKRYVGKAIITDGAETNLNSVLS